MVEVVSAYVCGVSGMILGALCAAHLDGAFVWDFVCETLVFASSAMFSIVQEVSLRIAARAVAPQPQPAGPRSGQVESSFIHEFI